MRFTRHQGFKNYFVYKEDYKRIKEAEKANIIKKEDDGLYEMLFGMMGKYYKQVLNSKIVKYIHIFKVEKNDSKKSVTYVQEESHLKCDWKEEILCEIINHNDNTCTSKSQIEYLLNHIEEVDKEEFEYIKIQIWRVQKIVNDAIPYKKALFK